MRAYLLLIVYKAVREIHQRYTNVFDQRLAKRSPKFLDRISAVYRHPPSGGIGPHSPKVEQKTSVDGMVRLDLVRQCVPRNILHGHSTKYPALAKEPRRFLT